MIQPDSLQPTFPKRPRHAVLVEPDLVARVRAGDGVAFELIMRRCNRRLYRIARSILKNPSEAEDVVQETYVRSIEKLDDFKGPDGFAAWLSRIAVNEALGRLRKRGRVISLDDYVQAPDGGDDVRRIETMRTDQPDPERHAAHRELGALLEGAIDSLPDDFRAVFILRAVEGLSTVETAKTLSIRPETVKTRFHRARRQLQKNLGDTFEALTPRAFEFAGRRCDRIVADVLARTANQLGSRATRFRIVDSNDDS